MSSLVRKYKGKLINELSSYGVNKMIGMKTRCN